MILASSAGGSNATMIIILVVMIALMYLMMIRPQSKEKKRVNQMLSELDIGDAILTSSGFYGVVIEIAGDDVIVEFGNNKNCRIPMKKQAIVQVEKPGGVVAEPVKVNTKKAKKAVEENTAETPVANEAPVEAPAEEPVEAPAEETQEK